MNKKKLDKYMSILLISVFLVTSLTGCIKKEPEVQVDDQSEIISSHNNDEESDGEDSTDEERDHEDLTHEIPYEIRNFKGELKDSDDTIVVECNVEYLHLKNIYNRPYIDSLNEEIRKRAEDRYNYNMDARKADYDSKYELLESDYTSKYEVSIEVKYAKNGVLSFVETSSNSNGNGVIIEVEGYTYSLRDEKPMELSDILVDGEVEKRNIIENECLESGESSTLVTEVTDEDLNDIGFYLNKDELVFLIPVMGLNRPKPAGNTEIYAPSYEENRDIYIDFGQYNL